LGIEYVRHLRKMDGGAALLRDDDAAELRRLPDAPVDADDGVARSVRDASGGHVLVGGANRADDLVDADAQRVQRRRPDLYQYLPRDAAVHVDARDARNVFQAFDNRLVRERGQIAQAHRRRGHRDRNHGLRVLLVDANDERILDVAWKGRANLRDP